MSKYRQIDRIPIGEHVATVTWTEKIADEDVDRCAEHAGIKVTENWVYFYPNADDPDDMVRLSRKRNKTAQVYLNMSIDDMVRQRIINRIRNSTPCCYRGEGARYAHQECTVHTAAWLAEKVAEEAATVRATILQVPGRRKIEAAYTDDMERRNAALLSGTGEWRKDRSTGEWCVYAIDRQPGDVVEVQRKNGTKSRVRLIAVAGDDLYTVAPLPEVVAA